MYTLNTTLNAGMALLKSLAEVANQPRVDFPEGTTTNANMLKTFEDIHAKFFAESTNETSMVPMLWIVFKNGNTAMVAIPEFGDPNVKPFLIASLKTIFMILEVERYGFAFESWQAMYSNIDERVRGLSPSQRDDRKECIMTMVADHDDKVASLIQIERKDNGAPYLGTKTEMADGFEGVMANLLVMPEGIGLPGSTPNLN